MTLKMNENMVFRKVGPNVVVVPVGKNVDAVRSIFSLNDSAGFILEQAKAGKTKEEIFSLLQEEFEVSSLVEAAQWLDEAILDLRGHGILL